MREPAAPVPLSNLTAVNVFWRGERAATGEVYPCTRIPSVVCTREGTLVAFAECRRWAGDGCFPDGVPRGPPSREGPPRDICLKRSVDGGATWSELQVIAYACSQPSSVWRDEPPGIVLNMNCGGFLDPTPGDQLGHINQMVSLDQGLTWTVRRQIDTSFGPASGSQVGPGNGLQLSLQNPHAPRRLLFIGHNGAYILDCIWYSDDHGKTYITANTSALVTMDEGSLVELTNGDVVANMRNQNLFNSRGVSIRKDGGATWGDVVYDTKLPSFPVMSPILRVGGSLFFSGPVHRGRTEGLVRRSDDDGVTWASTLPITDNHTGFAYSSLTRVPRGSVGMLWETGCDGCVGVSCCMAFTLLPFEVARGRKLAELRYEE